jgi:hypothetical protein
MKWTINFATLSAVEDFRNASNILRLSSFRSGDTKRTGLIASVLGDCLGFFDMFPVRVFEFSFSSFAEDCSGITWLWWNGSENCLAVSQVQMCKSVRAT